MSMADHSREAAIVGCLLGGAVGDALGLAYEGLSKRRAAKLFGKPDRYRFFFRKGMISDDTEHSCLVAQSYIASAGEPQEFLRQFAKRFRYWWICLPAGIGIATLKAGLRLWLGFGPHRSGVDSAGNGAAMRAAILGVATPDLAKLKELIRLSSRVTHTDPRAEQGALVIALAAHFAAGNDSVVASGFWQFIDEHLDATATEMRGAIDRACKAAQSRTPVNEYMKSEGFEHRITGFVMQTVPAAIFLWLCNPKDVRLALESAIECGGDTDTVAAIVGGIVGAGVGEQGIPTECLNGIYEWPRSVRWMRNLAVQLSRVAESSQPESPNRVSLIGVLMRNAFFLVVVLLHGFRRLLPPY